MLRLGTGARLLTGAALVIGYARDLRPRWLAFSFPVLDPVHLLMERKMLRTIRQRAEAQRQVLPSSATTVSSG